MMDLDDLYSVYLISKNKHINLLAVTVSGTDALHFNNAAENVESILYLANRTNVPVSSKFTPSFCRGVIEPLNYFQKVSHIIEAYNLPKSSTLPLDENAIELIRTIAHSTKKKFIIISTGCLTNIAHALTEHPSIKEKIERIIMLGGSLHTTELVTVPEKKLWKFSANYSVNMDPCAANIVLTSGIPLTVIPLDITNLIPLNELVLEKYAKPKKSAGSDFVMKVLKSGTSPNENKAITPFWNMVALMYLIDPKVVTTSRLPLKVVTDSTTNYSMLSTSNTGTMVDVCTDINPDLFYKKCFDMVNSY